MPNTVRDRLAAGKTATGIIVFSGSPMVVEVAAAARLDFVILDMEHSALDLERAAHLVRAADAAGIAAFVRVPGLDTPLINQLLNLGAAGIVLPHADRGKCAELVKAMRYAPIGERGACQITRSAGYLRGNWPLYAERANGSVMAIALIEDAAAIGEIDAIAAMPGIDACFVGPTDLSIALGVPSASFDDEKLGAALDVVVAASRRHGKYAMTLLGMNLDSAYRARVTARGVHMLVLGTDADMLMDVFTRLR